MSDSANDNLSLPTPADLSKWAEALRKFGEACREMSRVMMKVFRPAVEKAMNEMLRIIRCTSGPFYSRWYWKAAYWAADTFPDWVSVD